MRKIGSFLGSIVTRIGGAMLVLVALTGVAIFTGYRVFMATDADMTRLNERYLPALETDARVVDLTGVLTATLTAILLAPDQAELEAQRDTALQTVIDISAALSAQQQGNISTYAMALASVRQAIVDLAGARSDYFATEAEIGKAMRGLSAITDQVGLKLVERVDDAYFDARVATEELAASHQAPPPPFAVIGLEDPTPPARQTDRDLESLVDSMRSADELGFAVRSYYASALEAVLARDEAELMIAQDRLGTASGTISRLSVRGAAGLGPKLAGLDGFADPSTGIVSVRRANILASQKAQKMSWEAAEKVAQIREIASRSNARILGEIGASSATLSANIGVAMEQLKLQMLSSLGVVLLTIALVYLLIARPLRVAVGATDSLARGNLSAVDGLRVRAGEIGLLVSALHVFRDGILQKQQLEDEERIAREQRAANERALAEAERQREEEARRKEIAAQEHLRAREAEEAAQREALRRAGEQERQARAAAQNRVVAALAEGLNRLASGDLARQIEHEFEDGYDQLRVDFNAAIQSLSVALRDINASADLIFANSDGITQAARDLSRRTERSAATLEQSAAALHELTAAVSSAAVGSEEANKTVTAARKTAEDGDALVRQAIEAMGGISDSSNRISRIIDVIDDIAFQTNLLALNAGVEAARAGDAGRGFAVVASEVRALSQRSSEAAREIGALIGESVRQVGDGVDLVNSLGLALGNIVEAVGHISQNVSSIAASAQEQSSGISEINIAVGELDQSTQQNAAMVEQTTAATQELREQALALTHTLARFSLDAARPEVDRNDDDVLDEAADHRDVA